jgi:hypothetical protein
LADYQAWLKQLRGRLLKQHEHTQVRPGTEQHSTLPQPAAQWARRPLDSFSEVKTVLRELSASITPPCAAMQPAGTPGGSPDPACRHQERPAAV